MNANKVLITTTSLNECITNAFGSKNDFEKFLIYEAFRHGNKGHLYLSVDRFNNLAIKSDVNPLIDFVVLDCNLDEKDIVNFIQELDYLMLEASYKKSLSFLKP